MQLIVEYLEHTNRFEQMAKEALDLSFKRSCEDQAAAYRKLAEQRARRLNFPLPKPPPKLK